MSARLGEGVTISGIAVELSSTSKVFFDDPVITKGDLYCRDMAARTMPKPPGWPSGRRSSRMGASSARIPTASPEGGRHGNDPLAAR